MSLVAVGLMPWRAGVVSGHSMEPTLASGAPLLYDLSYYRHHEPRVGEVVLFRHNGAVWVKRVYATGGMQFWSWRQESREGVRHDPILASQHHRFAEMFALKHARYHETDRLVRLTVPRGSVFLVGDASTSLDSREIGPVDRQELLGRVIPLPGQELDDPGWTERSFPRPVRLTGAARSGGAS